MTPGWIGENFGIKTERIFIAILSTLICIILIWQCVYWFYFKDIKPNCQNNTRWVSEWPRVCIEVNEENAKKTGGNTIAKIRFQEGEKESNVIFDNTDGVYFEPMPYDLSKSPLKKTKTIFELCYFSGTCKFYRNKMVVKIEQDHIFNGEYDKIIFVKEPLE